MSLNVSDAGNHVDGATGDDHGWFSSKGSCSCAVDLGAGDGVNLFAVLVEVQVAEGHEVASDFFEAVVLALHGHQHVHLQDVLGAVELLVADGILELVQLADQGAEELGGVGAGALDSHAEEAGVGEVAVDAGGGVDEVVLLHQVGHRAAVHPFSGSARAERGR